MSWSEKSISEFQKYQSENGQTPMVRSVLRDAQLCSALKSIADG